MNWNVEAGEKPFMINEIFIFHLSITLIKTQRADMKCSSLLCGIKMKACCCFHSHPSAPTPHLCNNFVFQKLSWAASEGSECACPVPSTPQAALCSIPGQGNLLLLAGTAPCHTDNIHWVGIKRAFWTKTRIRDPARQDSQLMMTASLGVLLQWMPNT